MEKSRGMNESRPDCSVTEQGLFEDKIDVYIASLNACPLKHDEIATLLMSIVVLKEELL